MMEMFQVIDMAIGQEMTPMVMMMPVWRVLLFVAPP